MSDHFQRALDKQSRELAGPSPVEQHIILLKLNELIGNMPDMSINPDFGASPQRRWIAEVGALVCRVDTLRKLEFNTARLQLNQYWASSIKQIQGIALDVTEEIKLDLEISGKAEIGSAYASGEVYKFFAELKSIVSGAESEIFIIDPYFDGEAFNNYLADVYSGIEVRIFANKHAQDVRKYIDKHKAEYKSNIEIRKNRKLHDRLIIVDRNDCWITGGSVNHGGQKSPAYLIPLGAGLTQEKLRIYDELWSASESIV